MSELNIDQFMKAMGGTEIVEESEETPLQSVPGDAALASGYSYAEVQEARKYAAEIMGLAAEVGKITYKLIEKIDLFDRQEMYLRFGFENLSNWLEREHYSFAGIGKYLKIYRYFTNTLQIPRSRYETIDLANTQGFLKLAKAEATREDLEIAFDIAPRLSIEDWWSWSDNAAENLLAGRAIEEDAQNDSAEITVEPELARGYYTIEAVDAKDIGMADPGINGNLEKLRGIKSAYFKDSNDGTIILLVK
ncbi:MAG: hypothetical protein IID14_07465 [Candidatus Marinimicrobia bacterium]|nr:hypothetical protein [Candidatus Neomarinimicrobiota bacterium]